jgi:hypothetical protein
MKKSPAEGRQRIMKCFSLCGHAADQLDRPQAGMVPLMRAPKQ